MMIDKSADGRHRLPFRYPEDLARGLQREPAHEYAQTAEVRAVARIEQVVGPADGIPQRALAIGKVARAGGQHLQPMLQQAQQRRGREEPQLARGEFEPKWQA